MRRPARATWGRGLGSEPVGRGRESEDMLSSWSWESGVGAGGRASKGEGAGDEERGSAHSTINLQHARVYRFIFITEVRLECTCSSHARLHFSESREDQACDR